jgi:uncharacterized protein YkwD
MKKIITISCALLLLVQFSIVNAQNWTTAQIEKANTAKNIEYLTTTEKECILYINLCRLYPKEFLKYEVVNYYGTEKYGDYVKNSSYRQSLMNLLNYMQPIEPLYFDNEAYKNAKCFAIEQGKAGTTGHTRIACKDGNYAECCSYGMDTGKDIVLQLLIDHDVPSLGHRINCLNKAYTKVGVSVQKHINTDTCAVIDMIW